jgi:hypothetical protein
MMRNRLILIGLGLLLAGLLAILLKGLMQEAIIQPLLYQLWILRLYIDSIPQLVLWVLFIGVALLIAGSSLLARRRQTELGRAVELERLGQVAAWAEQVRLATGQKGYFQGRLARRLGQIALEVLSQNKRQPSEAIREELKAGQLEAPGPIRDYFQAGLTVRPATLLSGLSQSLLWLRRASPLDLNPEEVVTFLEDQLRGSRGKSA